MSVDADNHDLTKCRMPAAVIQLRNLIKITRFAKRAIMNLHDVFLRRNFCLLQSAPACTLTHDFVTIFSESQVCELSDFAMIL